jgi:hypothetical protein
MVSRLERGGEEGGAECWSVDCTLGGVVDGSWACGGGDARW